MRQARGTVAWVVVTASAALASPTVALPIHNLASAGSTVPGQFGEERIPFSIPRQAALTGLPEFGRQAGVTISAPAAVLRGRTFPALQGHLTIDEALARILPAAGLEVAVRRDGTIALRARSDEAVLPAASVPPPVDAVADVVVTALRRESVLDSVPAAVSAASGDRLTRQGVNGTAHLGRVAPGLDVRETANGGTRFTFRDVQTTGEGAVGLYFEDTPVDGSPGVSSDSGASLPDLRLFDVQRIEALRGPQGTLYGAGAMAGAVRLIFNKPQLNTASAATQIDAETIAGGQPGGQFQVMANLPLVQDHLAMRATGFVQHRGGYLDNSRLGAEDFNVSDRHGGRLSLRFRPQASLTFDAFASFQNSRAYNNNWNYTSYAAGGAPMDAGYDSYQPQLDRFALISGSVRWETPLFTLTALTSVSDRQLVYSYDAGEQARNLSLGATHASSQCRAYFGLGTVHCSDDQVVRFRAYAADRTPASLYSPSENYNEVQEIRLISAQDSPLAWTAGLFRSARSATIASGIYRVDPATGRIAIDLPRSPNATLAIEAGDDVFTLRVIEDQLEQTAAYGEATYRPTQRLGLTAGARYFYYDKTVGGQVLIGDTVSSIRETPYRSTRTQEGGWLFKAGLEFDLSQRMMLYAVASEGFRPGGVNQVIGLPVALEAYSADRLWSYELGIKGRWLDRRLSLAADVFRIDWRDMQVRATTQDLGADNRFGFITNVGQAVINGIELDLTARPVPELSVQLAAAVRDGRLAADQSLEGAIVSNAGVTGDRLALSSRFTVLAAVDYASALNPTWSQDEDLIWGWGLDLTYQSEAWTTFRRTDAMVQKLSGFAVLGARLSLETADGRWALMLRGSNLTNELGVQTKSSGPLFGGSRAVRAVGLQPRTVTLSLQRKF